MAVEEEFSHDWLYINLCLHKTMRVQDIKLINVKFSDRKLSKFTWLHYFLISTQKWTIPDLNTLSNQHPSWLFQHWGIIGHFRVILCLLIKMTPLVKPYIWKWVSFKWKWTFRWNSFWYEWAHTKTHFDTEAQSVSEMAYWFKPGSQKCSLFDDYISCIYVIGGWVMQPWVYIYSSLVGLGKVNDEITGICQWLKSRHQKYLVRFLHCDH